MPSCNSSLISRSAAFLAAAVMVSLSLTGCGMQESTSDGNSFVSNATISGKMMGGQQPILGATINLYAVGTTGYGSAPTLLATTTSGSGGSFQFSQVTTQSGPSSTVNATYGCPSNTSLLYLTAAGGDPTNTGSFSNPSIKLLDAIGACSTVKTGFYNIDEVSTVVSTAALQQYINPINETIGSPTTTGTGSTVSAASTGISNAFALVASILNYQYGVVNPTYNPTSAVGTVTATPEVAKINTIADILAACINTTSASSGPCNALYAAATPVPTALAAATNFATSYSPQPTAQDTLQAALFMLQNPASAGTQVTSCNGATTTTNLQCLFSLVSATPPFTAVTAQPTDWTVGVTYSSTSTQTVGASTVGYLNEPEYLAVDKSGNVWINNYVVPTGTGIGNGMTELSPTGGILQQVLTGSNLLNGPRIPVIDPSGNIWSPNVGSTSKTSTLGYVKSVVEFPVNGTSTSGNLFNTNGAGPFALASDGAGNIFVAETTTAVANTGGGVGTPGGQIEEITAGATSGSTATIISPTGTAYAASIYASMAVDSNFDVWVSSDAALMSAFTPPTSGTTYNYLSTTSGVTDSVGTAIDKANNVFVANYVTGGAVENKFILSGGAITPVTGSPYSGTGLTKSSYSVIDGSGNTWTTTDAAAGPITEISNAGVALSPSTGFVHTYYYPQGIAVDPSGNVWIGTEAGDTKALTAAGTNGPGGAAAGGYIVEIIGAAVPVITPIAAGLPTTAGGTSHLGTTPQ